MEQTPNDAPINGIPTAARFRIALDLVSVTGVHRPANGPLDPILRRLQGAEPYRDLTTGDALAWLRFVRRACNVALELDQFESPRQRARVEDLRTVLDRRIAHLAEILPPEQLPVPVSPQGSAVSAAMKAWLRSGSTLGLNRWKATVCAWAVEDGQAI